MTVKNAHQKGISHGTYFYLHLDDEFAAIGIDSREGNDSGYSDRTRKIIILNDYTIFFCQGVAGADDFSATNIAKDKFGQQKEPISLSQLAADWASDMIQAIRMTYKVHPKRIEAIGETVVSGVFVCHNGNDNVASVIAEVLMPEKEVFTSRIGIIRHPGINSGYQEIVQEVEEAKTLRAKRLLSEFPEETGIATADTVALKVERYVKAVRDWSGDSNIGGDIATIILERGQKWRWFHRPEFYPES